MLEQANKIAKMGAWSFDLISNELVWSDITKEIYEVEADYKPDTEAGINFYKEGVHRDAINRIVTEAMQKGGSWDEELIIVSAKGNEKWVRAMGQPEFENGVCMRLFGSFQDISERKRVKSELAQSRAEFKAMFDSIPDAVMFADLERRILLINPAVSKMFGYKDEELIGNTTEMLYADNEDFMNQGKKRFKKGKAGEQDAYEVRYKHKDGTVFWTETRGTQVLDESGKPIGFIGLFRDITERKENESELQKYRHQLEELVENRTEELQKSLAEKEVLLKEVHHRVKNNMAMVSAFIQLQMNGADDIYSLGALGACESRIQAMSMVHKRLYQSNDFTNIDMKTLFDEISSALFKESDFDNIDLDIQANEIYLEMDAAIPCAMIVNELLSNSLKYAFKDGQSGKIDIHMELMESDLYRIRVSDSGVGFPKDMNIENAETLGLQLVNVFVGQLNGEVKFSRKRGAAFEIVFPAGKTTNV
jgi:PAS domain S-box-containing protein